MIFLSRGEFSTAVVFLTSTWSYRTALYVRGRKIFGYPVLQNPVLSPVQKPLAQPSPTAVKIRGPHSRLRSPPVSPAVAKAPVCAGPARLCTGDQTQHTTHESRLFATTGIATLGVVKRHHFAIQEQCSSSQLPHCVGNFWVASSPVNVIPRL
jgi:hypothetical protein